MTGSHPPIHEPERVSVTCALGLQFLDVATGAFVGADEAVEALRRKSLGLRAEAWPVGAPRQKSVGIVTPSGILAFYGLAGLRSFENSQAANPWNPPPLTHEFQVEVSDGLGRFLPCTFRVRAPERGPAIFAEDGSPPWVEHGAVPLFSAPSRPLPAGLAVVRAELRELATERPAAWAMVEASYFSAGSERTARGLADDQGRVLLMFAYPEGQRRAFNGSPPAGGRGFSYQEWTLRFSVFYEAVSEPEAAADYGRRLTQPPVSAWRGSSPITLLEEEALRFGVELELKIIELVPA